VCGKRRVCSFSEKSLNMQTMCQETSTYCNMLGLQYNFATSLPLQPH